MKIIRVELVARDEQAEKEINRELLESRILNWPVYTWETLRATEDQRDWLENEYDN